MPGRPAPSSAKVYVLIEFLRVCVCVFGEVALFWVVGFGFVFGGCCCFFFSLTLLKKNSDLLKIRHFTPTGWVLTHSSRMV